MDWIEEYWKYIVLSGIVTVLGAVTFVVSLLLYDWYTSPYMGNKWEKTKAEQDRKLKEAQNELKATCLRVFGK